MQVLVLVADGCEELETVTFTDLMARAGATVHLAGLKSGWVKASRGLVFQPSHSIDQVQEQDYALVYLPGGLPGANHLRDDARVIKLLQAFEQAGKPIAAICAAPKVLLKAGLLQGRKATCFPTSLDGEISPSLQEAQVNLDVRQVMCFDGQIWTSRGPGTAMDFTLAIIERLVGLEKSQAVEQSLVRTLSQE
jgi:4-methyl-5(b-hydroxyethyl)-thiazole monophosphate biosynthesis